MLARALVLTVLLVLVAHVAATVHTIDGLRVRRVAIPQLTTALNKSIYFYKVSSWDRVNDGDDDVLASKPEHSGLAPQGFNFDPHADPRRRVYVQEKFTYGGSLWPSGLAVALGICGADRALFTGSSVLDVGCGVGLTSFAAAAVGARTTTALDISPLALKLVETAAAEMQLDVATAVFDVFSPADLPAADVVVFADILYTKPLGKAIADRVHEAARRGSAVVVGSQKGREGRDAFLTQLAALGIDDKFTDEDVYVDAGDATGNFGVEFMHILPGR